MISIINEKLELAKMNEYLLVENELTSDIDTFVDNTRDTLYEGDIEEEFRNIKVKMYKLLDSFPVTLIMIWEEILFNLAISNNIYHIIEEGVGEQSSISNKLIYREYIEEKYGSHNLIEGCYNELSKCKIKKPKWTNYIAHTTLEKPLMCWIIIKI